MPSIAYIAVSGKRLREIGDAKPLRDQGRLVGALDLDDDLRPCHESFGPRAVTSISLNLARTRLRERTGVTKRILSKP